MSALVLDLDDAFDHQPEFVSGAERLDARDLGPALRLWSRPAALNALEARLKAELMGQGPLLTFAGSGDFHHVSALLIRRAAEMDTGRPLTVLHVDNHPDWVRFSHGMHCGSWAARVARFAGVRQVISVAMCSKDMQNSAHKGADLSVVREGLLHPFPLRAGTKEECVVADRRIPTIEALGDTLFLGNVDRLIGTDDLYITIDKDALSPLDAVTNWDQGELRLERLLIWLRTWLDGRRLRGADIVGDVSRPVYGKGPLSVLLKSAEAWLDQPRRLRLTDEAARINVAANQKLRDCLLPRLQRAA